MTLIGQIGGDEMLGAIAGFQSLFSWMTLIGILAVYSGPGHAPFQSLFSWMTLIGPRSNRAATPPRFCFNPCFLG